mmetsp:Transcript_1305/g.3758  ORF Transcript_1305/g.3758 Transcript_1305/m.3758 type:complete len:96 (-) Transcript_1305:35-322(-)
MDHRRRLALGAHEDDVDQIRRRRHGGHLLEVVDGHGWLEIGCCERTMKWRGGRRNTEKYAGSDDGPRQLLHRLEDDCDRMQCKIRKTIRGELRSE